MSFWFLNYAEDVWEVLQSQFEKTQGLNIPLNSRSLQDSSNANIQYYKNGKDNQEQYSSNAGNEGNKKKIHFITNGESLGNGHNDSNSSNGNKTVMDQNGRRNIMSLSFGNK